MSDWPRGYYFDHPDLAAAWAAPRIVSSDERLLVTRIVELKGFGMNPDLTSRLANRGAAWMVDQVLQTLVRTATDSSAVRPCPA